MIVTKQNNSQFIIGPSPATQLKITQALRMSKGVEEVNNFWLSGHQRLVANCKVGWVWVRVHIHVRAHARRQHAFR